MADTSPKQLLVLAFDVEATGDVLPVCPLGVHPEGGRGDAMISVGWAGGRLAAGPAASLPKLEILVEPQRIDINLQKPKDVSWEDYWKTSGWSIDTFRRFWSHRLNTLDSMQQNTSSFALSAHLLNRELAALEEKYEIIPIVDAVGFDAPWIDVLLNSQGYRGLGQSRTGVSRRVLDAYSFRLGRALLDHSDAGPGHENGSPAAVDAFTRQREVFRAHYEHPHVSDRDAKGILVAYLSSLAERR